VPINFPVTFDGSKMKSAGQWQR